MNNHITSVGNETYVSLDFDNDLESLIPDEKRQNDIVLQEKVMRTYVSKLEIPPGFKTKYIPESLIVTKPDYTFDINYKVVGKNIILTKTLTVNNGLIKKSIFSEWTKDLKKLKKMTNELIILEQQ